MATQGIAAVLLILGASVVVYVYHFRMNRMTPGERERVTDWRFYEFIDWYLQISTIVIGVTAIVSSHPALLEFHDNPWLLALGLLIAGGGLSLFCFAMRNLDRQYTPAHAAHLPTQIVTTGPYRYIRHPVYTANLLMTAGVLLASGSLWMLLNLAILCVYYQVAMHSEETSIASRYPEYREYIARTGRIFPRLSLILGLDHGPQTALAQAKAVNHNDH